MVRKTRAEALLTRDTLIDVAERMIEMQGLSRTSLQDIASAAGVTRGAIYWHFKDKNDLVDAMMGRAFLPYEQALLRLGRDNHTASRERLKRHALHLFECVLTDARLRRFLEIATHKVEYVDELDAMRARLVRLRARHVALIERCLDAAGLPPSRRTDLALGLHAVLEGLIQNWLLSPHAFNLAEVGRATVDAFLSGLGSH
ncbi:MAG: TetR family transcriptional regulator [Gallionellaceae bacterium]|nr:TetR family transcriptional regulator [Gallionellaceae bacterium]